MLGDSNFNLKEKEFNDEKEISMNIKLNKTCFSIGETIHGIITLTPKPDSTIKTLAEPKAKFIFVEKENYSMIESYYDKLTDTMKPKKKNINNMTKIGEELIDFSEYLNANIIPNIEIPFQIKVPQYVCPSCLFGNNAYVIHFLCCEFKSLKVKKSVIIIIKNSPFFTKENKLLKIPAIYTDIITKHKYAIFSCGYFELKITLEKNICPYDENLQIIIDINCNNLSMIKLKAIKIYIYRKLKKKSQTNSKNIIDEKIEEMVRKVLPLKEGEKSYHIEDGIKLPISSNYSNPEEVYKTLDKDKREDKFKFYNVKLYPSCDGNLLSCQYFIKILIETNTLFSTNEEMIIPIDFYSPFKEKEEKNVMNKSMAKSINININKSFKLNSSEKILGEKINMNKLEQKKNVKDDDDVIKKYFDIKKEEFFNKNFDSSKEEEKKEKKLEPKDNIVEKDEDNNFEGFVTLPNYNKKKK